MQQTQHNKGFTLVELIVSIAIFAIVAAAIIAFFRMSMGQYRTNTTEVNLQTESQLTWKRLESNILMANQGIYIPNDHEIDLYTYDENAANKYIKTVIYKDPDSETNTIWFQRYTTNTLDTKGEDDADMFSDGTKDGDAPQVFANLVQTFTIEMYDKNGKDCNESGERPAKVVAHMEYEASPTSISSGADRKKYISDNTVAMRNAIVSSNVPSVIYANVTANTTPEESGGE